VSQAAANVVDEQEERKGGGRGQQKQYRMKES